MANGIKKVNEFIFKDGRTLNITHDISADKLEAGTLRISPIEGELLYVKMQRNGSKAYSKFDPNLIFEQKSITGNIIGDLQIGTSHIKDYSVTHLKLASNSVTNTKYENLSISADKLMDNSVISRIIMDRAVTRNKYDDLSISSIKLIDRCVTSNKVEVGNILDEHIPLNEIKGSKLYNSSVDYDKIKPYSIVGGEMATINSLNVQGRIAQHTITDYNIKENAIKERAIENLSISHFKLADESVYGPKIKPLGIADAHISGLNGLKLVSGTVSESKLATSSVSTIKIKDGNVTRAKLDQDTQRLMDEWIRVKPSQQIYNETKSNTAWIKGGLVVRSGNSSSSNDTNLSVHGNITATGTVTATKCYNPVFADLAEGYIPNEVGLTSGDAVCLSSEGGLKVEKLTPHNYLRFLGFVTDEYATVFGASEDELKTGKKIAVTLTGRIKVKLPDLEAKVGDYLCFSDGSFLTYKRRHASAIGRILEDTKHGDKYVLCQVWA